MAPMDTCRDSRSSLRNERGSVESATFYVVIAMAAAIAFFTGYGFVQSRVPSAPVLARAGAHPALFGGPVVASDQQSPIADVDPASAPVPGPLEASSRPAAGVQRVAIDASGGYFSPNVLYVRAGSPVELAFGRGRGELASVSIPALGLVQDLTAGGAIVRVESLAPGRYTFMSGSGEAGGVIIAR